ncbi:MAG: YeeE/YedE thiosulfate transporter family protein [Fimbriimonas sp.]|nr:YeeE/YedE thiosulfate transporter family protein [Fimbriimonas sp.]
MSKTIATHEPKGTDIGLPHGEPKPYWNPYAAGVGLGLTLVLSFYLMGNGLGASGAFTRFVAFAEAMFAPRFVAGHPYWKTYLGSEPILKDWLVFEILGALVGGIVASLTAGRFKVESEHGPRVNAKQRAMLAFAGGLLVGFATRFARGCTSGQALTGGSLLSVGSWAFMMSVFAGGYAAAWFVRRQWQ